MNPHTFIIAEAGVNHNGSFELAKKLITSARDCGADAIKFQTFKTEKLVSKKAPKARYQKDNTSGSDSQFEMLKKLELNDIEFKKLFDFCKKSGIEFLSTPFDEDSCDFLDRLGVNCFKIGSGEITNHPFIKHIALKGKPIILSTGMSTLGEVELALSVIKSVNDQQITLLHCVTEYPAPYYEINLRSMLTLKNTFKVPVGYSDHTAGIEIALAAVAMGAEIIEKHFTLDKTLEGPDHKASIAPDEFREMVRSIRNIELSLGDGIKRPANCEIQNISIARRSLHLSKNIKKGHVLDESDLVMKRPGNGLNHSFIPYLVGKTAKRNLQKDDQITLLDVE